MILSTEQYDLIKVYGRFCLPPLKIALLLDINQRDINEFVSTFNDQTNEIRLSWERGKALGEAETMEALDKHSVSGQDGAGEAAKALNYLKNQQEADELIKELFGV